MAVLPVSVISNIVFQTYSSVTNISVFAAFEQNRITKAKGILLRRLNIQNIEFLEANTEDEILGVIFTYLQCASSGVSRCNLDLLAQAVAGESKRDKINPDKFQKYVNMFSSLTRDELFICGAYLRSRTAVRKSAENILMMWVESTNTWHDLQRALVPSHYPSEEHIRVLMGGLARTGLVKVLGSTIDDLNIPSFSFLFDDIVEIVDFDVAYNDYSDY